MDFELIHWPKRTVASVPLCSRRSFKRWFQSWNNSIICEISGFMTKIES